MPSRRRESPYPVVSRQLRRLVVPTTIQALAASSYNWRRWAVEEVPGKGMCER